MKIRLPQWIMLFAAALLTIGCASPVGHNLPPAQRLMEPGPGVGGPGPGVIPPVPMPQMIPMAGPVPTVQFLFQGPVSMQANWDVTGLGRFDSDPLILPGRVSFPQGQMFRLKLTNIPLENREGMELYPTIEVASVTPRTAAFLEHNAVPIQFTPDDFEQVAAGNFVTKAIYLPNPEYQLPSVAGVDTIISTRLDQGVNPIVEADRRGSILAVIRVGNKVLEPVTNGAAVAQMGFPTAMVGNNFYRAMGSGVNPYLAPQYGMPRSGTPIGLVGPPHIPFGGPATLTTHSMTNRTFHNIPQGSPTFDVQLRMQPGYSYPTPPNRVRIREQSYHPTLPFGDRRGTQTISGR